jgi:hypothetical protein
MPFPASVPTLPRMLSDAGYATSHFGKWHLGDFFPKQNSDPSYAYQQWPVMNPGIIGFQTWFSTEASAASTTLNCGCDAAWPQEAPGCVLGGGVWTMGKSLACTNFWSPADSQAPVPACHTSKNATLACVSNSTVKVQGDSTMHMLERLGAFINASTAAGSPFFAALELHTNHLPHPSLPEFYHAYNGTNGLPAGDYLGTLSQMDAGMGALRQLLQDSGVEPNTLVLYFADNGPHPGKAGDGDGGVADVQTTTNGLRQCKASVFEGGIRVPGFASWPGVITQNRVTELPVYVPDVLPTLLELLGLPYPEPSWAVDGTSLLGLLRGDSGWARNKSLAWRLGEQVALLDATGRWKLVANPDKGQCAQQPSTYLPGGGGPFLFDLLADPTESAPLNAEQPARLAAMAAEMAAWEATILVSETTESRCLPPPPPPGGFYLQHTAGTQGRCLGAAAAAEHGNLTLSATNCQAGGAGGALVQWTLAAKGALALTAAPTFGLHSLGERCPDGTEVVLGEQGKHLIFDAASGTVAQPGCPGACLGAALVLADCKGADATGWSARAAGERGGALGGPWRARGLYRQPLD